MTDKVYNFNISYCRKRNNAFLDPFVSMKHIQKTNRVSSSQYTDVKGAHIGSQVIKNKKHESYDRYLRKLKSPLLKSNGKKTGIVKGCKCGSESELTYNARTLDISYEGPTYEINDNVYAIRGLNTYYEKATITDKNDNMYDISFNSDNSIRTNVSVLELEPYFRECTCGIIKNGKVFISDPTTISNCKNYNSNKHEFFVQMGSYFSRVKCL